MKKTKLIMPILIASLLFNALSVGIALSHYFFSHHLKDSPIMHMQMALSTLDEPYRDKAGAILNERGNRIDEKVKKIRELFSNIKTVMTAPSFDQDKMNELHKFIVAQDDSIKDDMLELIKNIAKSMPDDQRIKFFTKALDHPPPR